MKLTPSVFHSFSGWHWAGGHVIARIIFSRPVVLHSDRERYFLCLPTPPFWKDYFGCHRRGGVYANGRALFGGGRLLNAEERKDPFLEWGKC